MGHVVNINISSSLAAIMSEIAESVLISDPKLKTCFLSGLYEELLHKLQDYALSEDFNDIDKSRARVAGFSAIFNLLQYCPDDCEVYSLNFLENAMKMLDQSTQTNLDASGEELQAFYLCAVQCVLTGVHSDLSTEIGQKILDIVIDIFNQRGDVIDEGFIVISAISNKFPNLVEDSVNRIGAFIIHGLKSTNSAIMRNSAGVLSDLCTINENNEGIFNGYETYMPIVLNHLRDETVDRMSKINLITVIGDTFLAVGEKFAIFLEEVLVLLDGASKISVDTEDIYADEDELPYRCGMQSALIESYTCFMQNITDSNDSMFQTLGNYVEQIFTFLLDCCNPVFEPDDPKIKEIGGLIGDMAATYGGSG